MGGGGKVTVGYKYYIGMHLVTCYGPVDEVQEIRFGDRVAWSGSVTSSQTVNVSAEGLFGGEKREGGVAGAVDFMFGEPTQPKNSYLQEKLGLTNIPAFRGVMSFVFKSFYFAAMNPYLKDVAFLMKRIPANIDPTTQEISGDANAAHMLYEILTNGDWGMGYSTGVIDLTSFIASGQALFNEGLGLSMMWSQQTSIEEFIQTILDHVNGVLYVDRTDGKFHFDLIRDDYVVGNLPVFDETNIVDFESFERRSWGETVNELTVVYHDRALDEDVPVTVQAMGNIAVQNGEIISQTRQYPALSNGTIALRVAQRDLNSLAAPLAKVRLRVNREAFSLNVGGAFVVNWPKYGISNLVCRLAKVDMGSLEDGHITLEAVEDVFALPNASFTTPQGSGWTDPLTDPVSPTNKRIEEAGYLDLITAFGESLAPQIEQDSGYIKTIAAKPSGDSYNYEVWTKLSVDTDYLQQGVGDFSPFGTLFAEMVPEVQSTFNYENGIDADDMVAGEYIQIEGEKMEVISHDTGAKQMVVKRGILDTVPATHAAGSPIYGSQYFNGFDQTEYVTGEVVDVKLLTSTGKGTLALGSATTDQFTLASRKDLPYPPGNFRAEGELPYTTEMMTQGWLDFTWSHRDRTQQTVLTGFVAQDDGDIGPEAGTIYTMDLYGDGVYLTSVFVDGTSFIWDNEATSYVGSAMDPTKIAASAVLENDDRRLNPTVTGTGSALSAITRTGGRWYFEIGIHAIGTAAAVLIGVCNDSFDFNDALGEDVAGDSWGYRGDGRYRTGNADTATGKPTYSTFNTIMCAMDLDLGYLWFGKNGVWNDGDPATGASPSMTGIPATVYAALTADNASSTIEANLQARHMAYAPPGGFMPFGDGGDVQIEQWHDTVYGKDIDGCLLVGATGEDAKRVTTNTSGSAVGSVMANRPPGHDKWYCEFVMEDDGTQPTSAFVGCTEDNQIMQNHTIGQNSGNSSSWSAAGNYYSEGTTITHVGGYVQGDVVMMACDDTTGEIWFGRNGIWNDGGDPANGTNPAITQTVTLPRRPAAKPFAFGGIIKLVVVGGECKYIAPAGFEYAGSPKLQHRYWRLFGENNHGSATLLGLADLELITPQGGVDQTTVATVDSPEPFATSEFSSTYSPWRAFDTSSSTLWLAQSGNITNEAVGWRFDVPRKINEFSMQATNSTYYSAMPKDFRLEYSDDGVNYFTRGRWINDAVWTTVAERRNYVVDPDSTVEAHSVVRAVLRSKLGKYTSFTEHDYTFRRADYGYSYGMFYGGV